MSQRSEFHNIDNPADGLLRELAAGVTTLEEVIKVAPPAERT